MFPDNLNFEVMDSEATKLPHSSPWDSQAYLCSWCMESGKTSEEPEFGHDTSNVWLFNHVSEPIRKHRDMIREMQRRIDAADMLVFHNAKYDLAWLIHMGIRFDHKLIWCTMLGDYHLYGQNPEVTLSLNACAKRRKLGCKVGDMSDYWDNGYQTDEIPFDVHDAYVRQDVHLTKQLFLRQFSELRKAGVDKIAFFAMQLTKLFARMEYNGLYFDAKQAKAYGEEYKGKVTELKSEMQTLAGCEFSPSSSVQMEAIMYGGSFKREVQELVAKPRKNGTYRVYTRKATMLYTYKGLGFEPHDRSFSKKTGRYSTGKKARALLKATTPLQKDFLALLEKISVTQKVVSTLIGSVAAGDTETNDKGLVSKVDKYSYLHPNFNQTVTRTGRLSSSNPNGQNFPRSGTAPIKKLIKSVFGFIVNADLSQIEWRNAGALSKDKVMCEELWHDFDVHSDRARRSFGGDKEDPHSKAFKAMRQASKTFNFRMIYGGTAKAFFYDGAMPDFPLQKYEEIVQDFYKKYKGLRSWQLANLRLLDKQKYLRSPSGRVLTFKYNSNPDDGALGYSPQQVCNYPVQSFSTDCMLVAMYEVYKKLIKYNLLSKVILQVHDSLVFDCPPDEVWIVSKICTDAFESIPALIKQYFGFDMGVPITCEVAIGRTYGDLKVEYKAKEVTYSTINTFVLFEMLTDCLKRLYVYHG